MFKTKKKHNYHSLNISEIFLPLRSETDTWTIHPTVKKDEVSKVQDREEISILQISLLSKKNRVRLF